MRSTGSSCVFVRTKVVRRMGDRGTHSNVYTLEHGLSRFRRKGAVILTNDAATINDLNRKMFNNQFTGLSL